MYPVQEEKVGLSKVETDCTMYIEGQLRCHRLWLFNITSLYHYVPCSRKNRGSNWNWLYIEGQSWKLPNESSLRLSWLLGFPDLDLEAGTGNNYRTQTLISKMCAIIPYPLHVHIQQCTWFRYICVNTGIHGIHSIFIWSALAGLAG